MRPPPLTVMSNGLLNFQRLCSVATHQCTQRRHQRHQFGSLVGIEHGLLPIMWGSGTGSEVMSRIAAPMVGGMISSTVLTLAVIPAIYALVKQGRLSRGIEK